MAIVADTRGTQCDDAVRAGLIQLWALQAHSYSHPLTMLKLGTMGTTPRQGTITETDVAQLENLEGIQGVGKSGPSPHVIAEHVSAGMKKAGRALAAAFAAMLIDLARLNWEDQPTSIIDVQVIAEVLAEKGPLLVSISPKLVKARAEVFASSFFVPSGAYLTWVAMGEEQIDGEA